MKQINKLASLYLLFIVGLSLIILSLVNNYPITLREYSDFTISYVSPYYFIGLSISLVSLFFIMVKTKNKINKITCLIMVVLLFWSYFFFYPLLPGSDSHYFRGLTNYFLEEGKIDRNAEEYFQWPGLFIFAKIISLLFSTTNTGTLSLISFLLIGGGLVFMLYSIFEKQSKEDAPFMVLAYLLIMFYFINYQYAAQSLALVILLGVIVLTLDPKKNNNKWIILLFCLLVISHAFIALLFIFYLISYITLGKLYKKEANKNVSFKIIIICLTIYLVYICYISVGLHQNIDTAIKKSAIYENKISLKYFDIFTVINKKVNVRFDNSILNKIDSNTTVMPYITSEDMNLSERLLLEQYLNNSYDFRGGQVMKKDSSTSYWEQIDKISKLSSLLFLGLLIIALLIAGIILFFKNSLKIELLSIGLAGFLYMVLGTIFGILGQRGLQLAVIPLCCGISLLRNTKIKRVFLFFLIFLLFFFPIISLHNNLDNQLYQEYHEKMAGDFFVNQLKSFPEDIRQNEKVSIYGRHTVIYYIQGSAGLSEYPATKIFADRSNQFIYELSKDQRRIYFFYNLNLKKSLVKNFKISEKRVEDLEKDSELNYDKIYSNNRTVLFSSK